MPSRDAILQDIQQRAAHAGLELVSSAGPPNHDAMVFVVRDPKHPDSGVSVSLSGLELLQHGDSPAMLELIDTRWNSAVRTLKAGNADA